MASFRKARDATLVAYDSSLIDDEVFIALYDSCYSGNPELPFNEYPNFAFEEVNEEECCVDFRFKKNEIPALARVLNLPEKFTCERFVKLSRRYVLFFVDLPTLVGSVIWYLNLADLYSS